MFRNQWAFGNCLKACVATALNARIEAVPDPTNLYNEGDPWWDAYVEQVRDATGWSLEKLPKACCPPRNRSQIWIAGISYPDEDADHAILARDRGVVFEPLGEFQGLVPWNRLIEGMVFVPPARVVPNYSPSLAGRVLVKA